MPSCVLQSYVDRLSEVESQRRYDAAIAASVPHWEADDAREYLTGLWDAIEQARERVQSMAGSAREAAGDLVRWFRSLGFGSGEVEGD